jgi:tRNA-5-taurinomethyluridine 2-sulfurtransferase
MRIAVLVSGGVDSSVALNLLVQQGYDVTAFYLKIWLEDELSYLGSCPWEEDLEYVRKITDAAGVELHVLPFQRQYWDSVVAYTISTIKAGNTPNPDVMCNKYVKFGAFQEAISGEFDKVATGHYAQVVDKGGSYELHCSPDPIKDQTYFLSYINQSQLSRALFPVGMLTKEQVRAYAHALDLASKDRKDSQGICFLGKLKFSDFIRHHVGTQQGPLVEFETGKEVGIHEGFWYYTLGQRKSIRLSGGPWYVVAKDPRKNVVYISKNYYAPDKERNTFTVQAINWISDVAPGDTLLDIKLRHGPAMTKGMVRNLGDGTYRVELETRDQGIAPGQFAVFYDKGVCLGGGIIKEFHPDII